MLGMIAARFVSRKRGRPTGSNTLATKDADMSRQDANAAFALTSFLYGGNAPYIEDLYARYQADPNTVAADWQAFFRSLKDGDVTRLARGPSWRKRDWPQPARSELTAALDG